MWIALLFWLVWMLISALVANSKNRSAFGWALLSIPFGLFATIVVACLPRLPGAAERGASTQAPPEKTCPRCAEKVKFAAQVCRFCGHEFDPAETKALADAEKAGLPWQLVEDWGNGYGIYTYKGEQLAYRQGGVRWRTSQFDTPEIAIKSLDAYLS